MSYTEKPIIEVLGNIYFSDTGQRQGGILIQKTTQDELSQESIYISVAGEKLTISAHVGDSMFTEEMDPVATRRLIATARRHHGLDPEVQTVLKQTQRLITTVRRQVSRS